MPKKQTFPFVAINPTDGYYSATHDNKYTALQLALNDALNNIVIGRQPFSNLDQAIKAWLDNGGSQMRTEFEQKISAARG
jgi:putative aldouronate transport system substrate-binding protein